MNNTEKFVAQLSNDQVESFSQLIHQFGKIGSISSDNWLFTLLTNCNVDYLYTWAAKVGVFFATNIVDIRSSTQDFIELLKLRQFSLGINSGLVDVNNLNYLLFFYQYLATKRIYFVISSETPEKIQTKMRIDNYLSENFIYSAKNGGILLTSSDSMSIERLTQFHHSNRLKIQKVTLLTVQRLSFLDDWSKLPFELKVYQVGKVQANFSNPMIEIVSI